MLLKKLAVSKPKTKTKKSKSSFYAKKAAMTLAKKG